MDAMNDLLLLQWQCTRELVAGSNYREAGAGAGLVWGFREDGMCQCCL